MLFQKSLLSLITMFDCNSYPIQKVCIDGRYFLAYPIYIIRQANQKESSQNLEIKIEEHKQNDNTSLQYQYNNDTINFDPYMFPGQSKNYYKIIGNKLASFIIKYFDKTEIIKDKTIEKFLKTKKSKRAKKHMILLMKSKIARQIVKIYFGNYLWCSSILEQMKSDIQFYLCLNKQIFRRKSKQKKNPESIQFQEQN
ncbi:unnamed protein product (macronuclear) [Paramecium tetraurelia]|nr:uncharacterized protein GSPATT00000419001 [Paramecium tetraurelia]CAK55984.1 unnamed protein product [Paramecium tetraurelia]|eukprot:XP_001423382.1 hypothetical protein (macronuclear) [Paramecium tetraurelia strain d4-2]